MKADEAAMKELLSSQTLEDLPQKLNDKGADCTADEAAKYAEACRKILFEAGAMDMDAVAGGVGLSSHDIVDGGSPVDENVRFNAWFPATVDPEKPFSVTGFVRPLTNEEIDALRREYGFM